MKLDVILLAYNKEKVIYNYYEKICEELKGIKVKFIFVDNGSTDKTYEIFKEIQKKDEEKIKVISLSKKYDDYSAICSGLEFCKSDLACSYNFDYPTEYIRHLYDIMCESNKCDSICLCKKTKELNFFQKYYTKTLNKFTNMNIINEKTSYRIFNKKIISAIKEYGKENKVNLYTFDNLGFNICYENMNSNVLQKPEIIVPKALKTIVNTILIGLSLIVISFILLMVILIMKKFSIQFFIVFLLLMLSGFNLLSMGILGKDIFKHTNKSEPNYIIKEKYGFDDNVL